MEVSGLGTSELLDRVQRDRRFAIRLLKNLVIRHGRCEQTIEDFVAEPAERRLTRPLFRFLPAEAASGWGPSSESLSGLREFLGSTAKKKARRGI